MNKQRVFVIGVGMTKFEKPGRRANFDYPEMALQAGSAALKDAGIQYSSIEQAAVGYVYGESTCGQRALYPLGMTGIPIYNVNNNCATGSSALLIAYNLISGGICNCALSLGFEKMERGSLQTKWSDRTSPMDKHMELMGELWGFAASPPAAQMFGNAGKEHMKRYGTTEDHFAKIAWKNHKHSVNNPNSQFRDEYTLEEIKSSAKIFPPLTKLQCCPTSDGGAAAVVVSEQFVIAHGLQDRAVEILSLNMATDLPSTFEERNFMKTVGYDVTKKAANYVYNETGLKPFDIDVVELHDCFSANELITYEALGLCAEGKAGEFIDRGDNTYGGKVVVNPSGGLISKGHPLGATGLAQCAEICWQLRGRADKRQVHNAKLGMTHNVGLGGAAIVGIYRLGFPEHVNVPSPYGLKGGSLKLSLKSSSFFDEIGRRLASDGKTYVKKINSIFKFLINSDDDSGQGCWVVDAKNGSGSLSYGAVDAPADCTITVKDSDFMDMMTGNLDPQKAFISGKLKLTGNIMLAMKLKEFQPDTKIVEEASRIPIYKADQMFRDMQRLFEADGANIVSKLKASIKFIVKLNETGNESKIWFVDAKKGNGSIEAGKDETADCTITATDGDIVDIMSGKLEPFKAFSAGKLKLSGNPAVAMKLSVLREPFAKL